MAQKARDGRRVFINGDPIYFRMQTTLDPVAKALDRVEGECNSGDSSMALGIPKQYERTTTGKQLNLTKAIKNGGGDLGEVLCVFHEGDLRGEGTAQTRFTIAHRNEDGRVSLFTVSTEERADLYTVFPLTGDAPGGDFADIPRPRDSTRLFAATIEDDPYAVRIYETQSNMAATVKQYDSDMSLAGWKGSEAVAKEMPDARFYQRGEDRYVASFMTDKETGHTRVTLAPFQR
jgi:hypothetical protein